MTWQGVLGQLQVVAPLDARLQRRRAVAVREQLVRLRDELARAEGPRREELRGLIEDAEIVEREAWLAALVSVHRDATPTIDWREVAATPPPTLPAVDQHRSNEARRRLLDYRPDTYGLVDRRRALAAEVGRLVATEEAERTAIMGQWRAAIEGWSAWCSLTARVLCADLDAFREVIDASGCLDELHDVLDRDAIRIELSPSHADIELSIALRRSDELGERAGEATRAYASAAPLRVARELLAVLPIAEVNVHGTPDLPTLSLSRALAQSIDWAHADAAPLLAELRR
ncbi:MAG TPA: hypothetical protein VG755_16840 [Nannocystaceae bacterium]|nr:hypothetical protein [Nannocystaceae bacterium]